MTFDNVCQLGHLLSRNLLFQVIIMCEANLLNSGQTRGIFSNFLDACEAPVIEIDGSDRADTVNALDLFNCFHFFITERILDLSKDPIVQYFLDLLADALSDSNEPFDLINRSDMFFELLEGLNGPSVSKDLASIFFKLILSHQFLKTIDDHKVAVIHVLFICLFNRLRVW